MRRLKDAQAAAPVPTHTALSKVIPLDDDADNHPPQSFSYKMPDPRQRENYGVKIMLLFETLNLMR